MKNALFILLFSITASFCKHVNNPPAESEVKWGHLPYADRTSLLKALPKSKIYVCGKNSEYVKMVVESIKVWSTHTRRRYYLTIEGSCDVVRDSDTLIKVFYKDELIKNECSGKTLAYAWSTEGIIVVCRKDALPGSTRMDLFHEVGHLWGMCDQYNSDESGKVLTETHGKNCDPKNQDRALNEPAIMSAGQWDKYMYSPEMTKMFKLKLYQDDIKGIRALSQRNEISANIKWKEFLELVDKGDIPNREPTEIGELLDWSQVDSNTDQPSTIKERKLAVDYLTRRFNSYLKFEGYKCRLEPGPILPTGPDKFIFSMTFVTSKYLVLKEKHEVNWNAKISNNDLEKHLKKFSIALDPKYGEFRNYCKKKIL